MVIALLPISALYSPSLTQISLNSDSTIVSGSVSLSSSSKLSTAAKKSIVAPLPTVTNPSTLSHHSPRLPAQSPNGLSLEKPLKQPPQRDSDLESRNSMLQRQATSDSGEAHSQTGSLTSASVANDWPPSISSPLDRLLSNLEHAFQFGVEGDGAPLSVGEHDGLRLIEDPIVQIGPHLALGDSNFDMHSLEELERVVQGLKSAEVPKAELREELQGLFEFLVKRRLSRIVTWMNEHLSEGDIDPALLQSPPDRDSDLDGQMATSSSSATLASSKKGRSSKRASATQKRASSSRKRTSRSTKRSSLPARHDPSRDTEDAEVSEKIALLKKRSDSLKAELISRWRMCDLSCTHCGYLCNLPVFFHTPLEVEEGNDSGNNSTTDSIPQIVVSSTNPPNPSLVASVSLKRALSSVMRSSSSDNSISTNKQVITKRKSLATRTSSFAASNSSQLGLLSDSQRLIQLNFVHNCFTGHICGEPCSKGCQSPCTHPNLHKPLMSSELAAEHLCDNMHRCLQPCQFVPFKLRGCLGKCQHDEGHIAVGVSGTPHDCGQPHGCNQFCAFCDQFCKHLFNERHKTHTCAETECRHLCEIHRHCSRPCSLGHQHTELHYCGIKDK